MKPAIAFFCNYFIYQRLAKNDKLLAVLKFYAVFVAVNYDIIGHSQPCT